MEAHKSLFLIAATMLAGCAAAPPKAPVAPPVEKPVEVVVPETKAMPELPAAFTQKGVAIKINSFWQSPDGQILGVNGTAKNVTASDLKFCQVSLAFLDPAGAKLDDAKASTKSLKSAQVWHFQAALAHPSQAAYATILPEKVVAIPVKADKAELASLK